MSPAKPKLADPGALIRGGKPRTEEFRVCMDPDLVAEYERLLAARDAAKEAAHDSLAGGRAVEVQAEIDGLLEEMEAATITLVLKSLSRPQFRAFVDKYPQRKDSEGKLTHPGLDYLGVNFDEFFNALIPASLVEPNLDEETLTILLEERLTDQQYIDLALLCWNLNKTSVDVPFSPAVSPKTRRSSRK